MAQAARPLTPHASAHHQFGAELRRWRLQRRLSQDALGRLVHASGDLVAKVEKAQRWPAEDFVKRCDSVLDTGNALVGLLPLVEAERRHGCSSTTNAVALLDDGRLPQLLGSALPVEPVEHLARQTLRLPAGSLVAGTSLNAWLAPASSRRVGGLAAPAPPSDLARPGDLLVVQDPSDPPRLFAIDARRRPSRDEAEVTIPLAYQMDDFTMGVLWATRALDDALLDDDRPLADVLDQLPPGHVFDSPDAVPTNDLTGTPSSWLGSYACARFITAHLTADSGPPLFWTREQRGEEAATWLLFGHKVEYLRTLRHRFPGQGAPMGRMFCLPEATAARGTRAERVLLLLAAALMEASGVAIHVCVEPEYSAVEGFVLRPDGTVIVANWLRADRVWHAEVIHGRTAVRPYRDLIGFGRAHSIVAADTSTGRLQRLAEYLQLDWAWLTLRFAAVVGGDRWTGPATQPSAVQRRTQRRVPVPVRPAGVTTGPLMAA